MSGKKEKQKRRIIKRIDDLFNQGLSKAEVKRIITQEEAGK